MQVDDRLIQALYARARYEQATSLAVGESEVAG